MNGYKLLSALGDVRPDYLTDAAPDRPARRNWRPILAAAACLALLLGGGGWAYGSEMKEYNAAVAFFEEYDLPVEGLTRAEVKTVYRDIKTNSFTYEKTGQVLEQYAIQNSAVGGLNITPEPINKTPEELGLLWQAMDEARRSRYQLRWEDREDPELGFLVHDKSILEHYEDGQLAWSAVFPDFLAEAYREVPGGLLVWGVTYRWSSTQPSPAWLAKVSDTGEVLWQACLDHGFQWESISVVLTDLGDTYTLFSRGELESMVFSRWSADGKELASCAIDMQAPYGIKNAARLGEDYVVQLTNSFLDAGERIVRVDREGRLAGEVRYTADDSRYFITDMVEYCGKLYLSAYAVPIRAGSEESTGGRWDIFDVVEDIMDAGQWSVGEDGLVQVSGKSVIDRMREHYTAVLLVCDPDSGTPETFFSVQEAVGGALTVEGGRLSWDTEQFVSAYFSPYTSAYSIWTDCQVFRHTFSSGGELVSQTETGEMTVFAR